MLEGTFYIGGQEHFYMEPNAFLVQPVSEGHYTQLHVYATTQGATVIQKSIAEALGNVSLKGRTKSFFFFIHRSQF